MVEDVEELCPELHRKSFHDRGPLEYGEVKIDDALLPERKHLREVRYQRPQGLYGVLTELLFPLGAVKQAVLNQSVTLATALPDTFLSQPGM